ncbi:MAG TPA: Lrp/AsnC family transcriptional regulator [Stellaceae bacterium]|jgi:DNA-binding Lrp family transcriptional regulator|nr:Lrp/AsnC family transcriptional regulator [Stellaceae bacterium]
MRRFKLDRIDRQILRDLQDDGRMTNVELAARAGISAPPCLRRVRALEEAGYIKGYHAEVDAEALGFTISEFVQVGLTSQNEADLLAFETLLREWPEVRQAHMLKGEVDFLLKVVFTNFEAGQRFHQRLRAAPNVAHVKTSSIERVSKNEPGVVIDLIPVDA